jgi:hypothetical protein
MVVDLVEDRPGGGEEEVDPGDSCAAESVEHGDGGGCERDAVIVAEDGGHPQVGLAAVLVLVAEDPVAHDLQGGATMRVPPGRPRTARSIDGCRSGEQDRGGGSDPAVGGDELGDLFVHCERACAQARADAGDTREVGQRGKGAIHAGNHPGGGAVFTISLPLDAPGSL